MGRVALILLPLGVAVVTFALASAILPACAVGVWPWATACPPVANAASADRQEALAARRAALEAEIAAVQRRIAALPDCPVVAAVEPEPPPAPEPDIPEDRWANRDIGLLEGCWNLDSDYQMQRGRTGPVIRVASWQVCFDAQGRGRQTQVFTDGMRCEGPINGRFNDAGLLEIADAGHVPCTGNSRIIARTGTCTLTPEGRAQCETRHPSMPDSPPSAVTLRR